MIVFIRLDFSNNNISCSEGAGAKKKGVEVEQVDEDDLRIDESRISSNTKQSDVLEDETGRTTITHQDSLMRFAHHLRFLFKKSLFCQYLLLNFKHLYGCLICKSS